MVQSPLICTAPPPYPHRQSAPFRSFIYSSVICFAFVVPFFLIASRHFLSGLATLRGPRLGDLCCTAAAARAQHRRLALDIVALGDMALGSVGVEATTAVRARHERGVGRGGDSLWHGTARCKRLGAMGAHADAPQQGAM